MLGEFIDFVDSVLPSVDPEARDKAKTAIEQFNATGHSVEYILPKVLPLLSQGDVISEIPFSYFGEDGQQYTYKAKGMIISTSCHVDQKESINIVPVFPMSFFEMDDSQRYELKANRIFDFMYLPDFGMSDYFVDFSRINTYNKKLIVDSIKEKRIDRLFSLSQIGFYLFIIKLTVFLMRKEDNDTIDKRKVLYN